MIRNVLAAAVVVILGGAVAAADLKSGPQAGEKVPGPFHPLNINGEDAGKKSCLYCRHGDSPVVAVFARTAADANLQKLIAALDTVVNQNQKAEMGGFVVYLSADDELEGKLKEQADKAKYKQVVLAIDTPAGPEKYNIAKTADVTVLLYKDRVVAANHTFGKGQLTAKDVYKIVGEASKLAK